MPSKPVNTDHEPLELADGWDREADPRTPENPVRPSAANPWEDWDTPLDDITWDEPDVKKATAEEDSQAGPEEVLPPVTGDKLVELVWDDNLPAAAEPALTVLPPDRSPAETEAGLKPESTAESSGPDPLAGANKWPAPPATDEPFADPEPSPDMDLKMTAPEPGKNAPGGMAAPPEVEEAPGRLAEPTAGDGEKSDWEEPAEADDLAEAEVAKPSPLDFSQVMAQVAAENGQNVSPSREVQDWSETDDDSVEDGPAEEKVDGPAAAEELKSAKIELDIEDRQLESGQSEEDKGPEESEPQPVVRTVPLIKLLILVAPAILLLATSSFVGYKLFFSSPPEEKSLTEERPQDVWPVPPPAGPGDFQLEPFFFLLSGHQAYVPVEVRITVFYDNPELVLDFKDDLILYRDYIFRYIQNQDDGILTDQDRQEKLHRDLLALINQKLGLEAITHIRIVFRR